MFGLDEWIARSSGGTTLLIVVAVAALLGLRHATDPDHLAAVTALIATGDDRSGRAARRLGLVLAADTIVIGLPQYNFGPPSTFKAWFDRIVVPDLTIGQLADTEIVVVTARGGGYSPSTPREGWDHREPWLRHALSTLGVNDPVFIDTELTLARESPAMTSLDLGGAEDRSLADALAALEALVA